MESIEIEKFKEKQRLELETFEKCDAVRRKLSLATDQVSIFKRSLFGIDYSVSFRSKMTLHEAFNLMVKYESIMPPAEIVQTRGTFYSTKTKKFCDENHEKDSVVPILPLRFDIDYNFGSKIYYYGLLDNEVVKLEMEITDMKKIFWIEVRRNKDHERGLIISSDLCSSVNNLYTGTCEKLFTKQVITMYNHEGQNPHYYIDLVGRYNNFSVNDIKQGWNL